MRARLVGFGRRLPPRLGVTGVVFLAINLFVLAMYLWSLGGQTTTARVEIRGNRVTAYVDGELKVKGEFAGPAQGDLSLSLGDTEAFASLPRPRGIDSVRVTDIVSGEVLFEDDFSDGVGDQWLIERGTPLLDDGVVGARGITRIRLVGQPWTDHAVEVVYKNITRGGIIVRDDGNGGNIAYSFRPFRHYDNSLSLVEGGQSVDRVEGLPLEVSRTQTIKSMAAMTLQPYPWVLLLLATGFMVVLLVQVVSLVRLPFRLPTGTSLSRLLPSRLSNWLWYAAAAGVATGAFGVTLFLNLSYGSGIPHVPDSVVYVFQAKMFASAQLSASPPPVSEVFEFFEPPLIVVVNDRWVSAYPFGHPLALAFGVRLGALWLVPPLIGAASVALVFAIGRKIYDARVGLLAAILLASSPFFFMTASNFMSHNTAAFYLLASLFFLAIVDRRPMLYGAVAGLCFGLLFNTRPLVALSLIVPFGVYFLLPLLDTQRRPVALRAIGGFLAGGLVMLAAFLLYNLVAVGDAFGGSFEVRGDLNNAVGFSGSNSLDLGIQNVQVQLASLLLVLNGWPQIVGLALVMLPFIFGTRHRWDWFLLACVLSLMAVYTLVSFNGIMHGPRFWYPAAPLLMLLSARGAEHAAQLLSGAATSIRGWFANRQLQNHRWTGIVVVYALIGVLVGTSMYGWLLSNNRSWRVDVVPANATELQEFNDVNNGLVQLIEDADLDNALVLLKPCAQWWCFGSVFWMNSPSLDGNIVIAEDLDGRLPALYEAFPDRNVYLADYGSTGSPETASLVPIDELETPRAWPAATPTPSFAGGRDPIVSSVETSLENLGVLENVLTARHASFDSIVFEFRDALPSYRVEYVSAPLGYCGSERPVNLSGDAFLQVRFASATADPQELQTLTPHFLSLQEGTIICDFEGDLIWLFSMSAEVDFTVVHSEQFFRVTIDVGHP